MTAATETSVTTQVYRVYIKAAPQAVWDAITKPEWTEKYGWGGRVEFDLRAGGAYTGYTNEAMRSMGAPDVAVDGEVIEVDPPRKLVQSYRALWSDDVKRQGTSRVTWEIEPVGDSCRLTVTHDRRMVKPDEAQAFRIGVGGRQCVAFRSLKPEFRTAFLGHQTFDECLIGWLNPAAREVEAWLRIE